MSPSQPVAESHDAYAHGGFLDHLQQAGVIDPSGAARVRAVLSTSRQSLDVVLLELGLIPEARLADEQAAYLGFERALPADFPDELPAEVNASFSYYQSAGLLPVSFNQDSVTVLTSRPFEQDAIRGLSYALGREPNVKVAAISELHQHLQKLAASENSDDPASENETAEDDDIERLRDFAREAPIVKLLNRIIATGIEQQASDIHLEPLEDCVLVRYRIDGALEVAERLPKNAQQGLTSRVKILAKLNIAEHRLPQDGRLRLAVRGNEMEFRVSTTPVVFGESVALRVLDRQSLPLQFKDLGFTEKDSAKLRRLVQQTNGIVLVTGPTGSGKTTTLYAALNGLNTPDKKLFSVEDPVEYNLRGINQINVKPQIGLDFAAVLRSVLRQDPDIVMIGEIRDLETARIAIQASLTGHLVLSTLHTNSAAASITRLLDMGLEEYLLASCLRGVVAQRLLRTLCDSCKSPMSPHSEILRRMDIPLSASVHQANGCDRCRGTGYRGRTVVSEIMDIGPLEQDAIAKRLPESQIQTLGEKSGMTTLFKGALQLVGEGVTSLEEVFRVIQSPLESDSTR
jgi:general secretion pathway protein E